ncbi:MAG: tRNA (adenosine(37)-N6)-threonylcarbamoyltransferase complex dimerization subunit type 1 TsaB [Desulfotignum sp.]|nr:tRNA (adenosine(37)-N6)-threonylcarbamoyltransferase complex dimerization subunit type 1 TsaB [Desulfobacteraceae bacterium]
MNLLALSTAEPGCSLAVFHQGQLVYESVWHSRLTHSRRMLAMIAPVFPDQAGFALSDVDGFVAAKGPGSFTGLRIGISTIMGLACAVSKPAAGVSSLDGIAFRFSCADMPVCAMMDARRSQVYCAVYRFDKGQLVHKTAEQVCPPEEALSLAHEPGTLFAGSGALAYQDLIAAHTSGHARLAPPDMHHISAAALARPALSTPDFFTYPANTLAPSYLRHGVRS